MAIGYINEGTLFKMIFICCPELTGIFGVQFFLGMW